MQWLLHHALCNVGNPRWKCGAEQEGLPRCGNVLENGVQRRLKPHIEHAVGFVKYQGAQLRKFQGTFAQVLFNTSRRADNDVRSVCQRANLRAKGRAATEGEDLDVVDAACQAAQFVGDLVGKLSCGAEHQRLHRKLLDLQLLQQPQPKSRGLARAGFTLGDDIPPGKNRRQAFCLYRRHPVVVQRVKVGQQVGVQRQCAKGFSAHGSILFRCNAGPAAVYGTLR